MARDFPGSASNHLNVGNVAAVDVTGTACTVCCWMHADAVAPEGYMVSKHSRGIGGQILLGHNASALNWHLGHNFHNGGALSTGVWTHVCIRRDGTGTGSSTGWINGTQAHSGTDTVSMPSSGHAFVIGNLASNDGVFNGRLAHVALWDAALTADEIGSLADGFSPLMIRPQSLRGYWPIHGNASPEPDLKNGNNGTVVGTLNKADSHRIIMPREAIYIP